MWVYDDNRAAIRDALRLSEGMTYKSAVAGLPLGGGKGVIVLKPGEPLDAKRRRAALVDFGDAVERLGGTYVTAKTFTYDTLGRASGSTITVDGTAYSYATAYNGTNGAVDTVTYPSTLVIKTIYNT